jgi:hypothetical protein
MTDSTARQALRALPGLLSTTGLGLLAVAVIVFGLGWLPSLLGPAPGTVSRPAADRLGAWVAVQVTR